jgi:iron-sulfur cluster repair protein YtfE (RIC family)
MKATTLLVKQHTKVKGLFKKLESGKGDPSALLPELANDLGAHMAIEQQIFYPAIRSIKEDLVAESFEEHALGELALKRLLATPPSDASFKAKVTSLKELIEHHVEEEEEELFPAVEKRIDEERLEALGKQMKTAFDAAVARGFEALVPKTMAKTSADVDNKPSRAATGSAKRNGRTHHATH